MLPRKILKFQFTTGMSTMLIDGKAIGEGELTFLSFGNQREVPTIWVEADPEGEPKSLEFQIFGTGGSIGDEKLQHVGTAIFDEDMYVAHLYQRRKD